MHLNLPVWEHWVDVTPPAGWNWSLPFTVQRRGRRYRAHPAWSLRAYAPAGKAYYVSTAGSDGNDGLSWGAPLRTVQAALGKGDIVECHVAAGLYTWNQGWDGLVVAKNLALYGYGGVTFSRHFAGLAWALDTPDNPNAYKTARSNAGAVNDARYPDANGDLQPLTRRSSATEVSANPGSWYTDGVSVWLRAADSRAPDGDLRVYAGIAAGVFRGAYTLYCSGISFEGGLFAASVQSQSAAEPAAYYENCRFLYATGDNGLSLTGGRVTLRNCLAARNYDDGFNHHAANGFLPYAIEIDCASRHNGQAGEIDNGSSVHDGGRALRLNGDYHANLGRNLHDVGAGAQSWNCGVHAHDSASALNNANFAVGTGGGGGEMWLERCRSYGSVVDLEEDSGATLRTRLCETGGAFSGGVEEY